MVNFKTFCKGKQRQREYQKLRFSFDSLSLLFTKNILPPIEFFQKGPNYIPKAYYICRANNEILCQKVGPLYLDTLRKGVGVSPQAQRDTASALEK